MQPPPSISSDFYSPFILLVNYFVLLAINSRKFSCICTMLFFMSMIVSFSRSFSSCRRLFSFCSFWPRSDSFGFSGGVDRPKLKKELAVSSRSTGARSLFSVRFADEVRLGVPLSPLVLLLDLVIVAVLVLLRTSARSREEPPEDSAFFVANLRAAISSSFFSYRV